MQVPTPTTFIPSAATLSDDVEAIPASRGIYAIAAGNPDSAPHLSWSINLRRRLNRLLVPSYTAASGILSPFAQKVASISYWTVSSRLETLLILYELSRRFYPDRYLKQLHLRMPWLIGLTSDAYSRFEIANRTGRGDPPRFGPFRTRDAAQLYQEQILGLFQLRRCDGKLEPAPDHPGCIYGEMNQCLRPCQLVVSQREYTSEVERASSFLASSGKSASRPLTEARDRAAADMDFEQAAAAHKRLTKVQAAIAASDKAVRQIQNFHGVVLIPAVQPESVNFWPIYAGFWQTPLNLQLPSHQGLEFRSLDTMLRQQMQAAFANPSTEGNRLEHMALFSRWYYSSWREGDWFPFDTLEQLSYRRLVKAVSTILKSGAA